MIPRGQCAIIVGEMSRPLSNKADKRVRLEPATVRALMRARLDAEERGDPFPDTLSEALELALREWLQMHHPEALVSPGPGRPRKASAKKP